MPPKKKGKGGKKGKKGKKGKGDKGDGDEAAGTAAPSAEPPEGEDREELLAKQLQSVNDELAEKKRRVEELRKENEWLQQEAHQTRVESHEYMSYMAKKTHKRQSTIVSLSDQNQKEIEKLQQEKSEVLAEYEQKKAGLRQLLLERENELAKTKKELQELDEFKKLQADQISRIKDLEREVLKMRGVHSDTLQQLKAQFLKEKSDYQHESDQRITSMGKLANKEAARCLDEHTQMIKLENRQLRHELLNLIKETRALHEHKLRLEDQRKELLREQQYAKDLAVLRSARQHKVLKSFGLLEDQQGEDEPEEY
ncbi:coiled-coil domain-containing protein 166-like [Branchiostoma floridae x Branchiostoma japonicum]|uniref:DUF4515 domain-containing protein n=1 Tax=Branchiostoma floridae TaxID=7739 RepID=C3Z7V0_BRAFL|eukprot:XP_002595443.1 hypothetical protein BRAFLDRAFT_119043 [Branchiostoma floridae]